MLKWLQWVWMDWQEIPPDSHLLLRLCFPVLEWLWCVGLMPPTTVPPTTVPAWAVSARLPKSFKEPAGLLSQPNRLCQNHHFRNIFTCFHRNCNSFHQFGFMNCSKYCSIHDSSGCYYGEDSRRTNQKKTQQVQKVIQNQIWIVKHSSNNKRRPSIGKSVVKPKITKKSLIEFLQYLFTTQKLQIK